MPHIVVIGASAGGIDALRGLVRGLPPDLLATVFVVIHLSPLNDASMLANALSMPGRMKVASPHDGEPIQPGRIYVAGRTCICSSSPAMCGSLEVRGKIGTGPESIHCSDRPRGNMAGASSELC